MIRSDEKYNTSMQFRESAWRRLALAAAATACALTQVGCSQAPNTSILGTFRMGEKVQVGSAIYTVLESESKPALTEGGRAPKNRFLILHLSIANTGGEAVAAPTFELEGADGTRYPEVNQHMEGVPNWLGLLRTVPPGNTERGSIVFDVPMAAYKLVIPLNSSGGDERYALVEIPVQLE